ncbi:extracellular calcium-sensing receptor [Brienomyrus brachyistius]|uniref:extracellular calcium-sensing receptor n=1 Tax=Brienomyrus brachyistius TaxID=42636 RepID=UPI0020B1CC4C|nr:extracellular calcium-sensing receptor [Brienomyrus brachyistius]
MRAALALWLFVLGPGTAQDACHRWEDLDTSVVHKSGDVILGGMFPIHSKGVEEERNFRTPPDQSRCRGFNLRVFRWSQAMVFFIEKINQDPSLLPNITLGYRLYDTCGIVGLSVKTAMSVISQPLKRIGGQCGPPSISLIIGDSGSTLSMAISRVLNLFRVPLVSYFASCACLSNKRKFPYFFRTIPSDVNQADALARLVKHFGWTWVGTVGADDDYGRTGIDMFTAAVTRLGVCVAYRVVIPKIPTRDRLQEMVKTIRRSTARVIVAFAIEEDIQPLIQEIIHQNVTGKQWVASEAWVTSTLISTQENFASLSGTIGFGIRRADIPGFKHFLESLEPLATPYNPFAREFWETQFQCSLNATAPYASTAELPQYESICTGSESIRETNSIYNDVSQLRVTYNVHKAVYSVAQALHALLGCGRRKGCADPQELQPWQVVQFLKEVNYSNSFGDVVYFDESGDPVGSYDIINWQREGTRPVTYVMVGRFDATLPFGEQLVVRQADIVWHGGRREVPLSVCSDTCHQGFRKATRTGQPVCCYDCVACADGTYSNLTDQDDCTPCPEDFWSNVKRDGCIVKETEFLSYTEVFGLTLAAVAILGAVCTAAVAAIFSWHRDTPLVRANNSELSFLLLLALAFCFLCALAFLGRPSAWSCRLRRTAFGLSFALCLSCLLSKTLVVLMAFRATLPDSNAARWFGPTQQRLGVFACTALQGLLCGVWLAEAPPYPVKNTWLYRDRIILECHLGSLAFFCCVLGYIGCLAGFCFILAFLARKLPDNFNEAKFITFSMLIFTAVWITFIPAYVSSPGKFTVAVEIFAILASSFGLLFCIFAPKCYIIIFMPEKNTKKHLLSQRMAK